ncbi:hypothetical protein MMC25_005388 [Agyrium rufum]|nr:hypothetical protein [Agyrium rufum]
MSLVAERSGLLEPLRDFVKVQRKPTWGTCAGLILLAESANRTKKGGQELIGGLDVRVNRNHFGRQTESFEADLQMPFLKEISFDGQPVTDLGSFHAIFIRAPVVERLLPVKRGEQSEEADVENTVIAPSKLPAKDVASTLVNQPVEILATVPIRRTRVSGLLSSEEVANEAGDIVAVKQGNVFGTSFHPELTTDARLHQWWLEKILKAHNAPLAGPEE